jgi:hypothetical protein
MPCKEDDASAMTNQVNAGCQMPIAEFSSSFGNRHLEIGIIPSVVYLPIIRRPQRHQPALPRRRIRQFIMPEQRHMPIAKTDI